MTLASVVGAIVAGVVEVGDTGQSEVRISSGGATVRARNVAGNITLNLGHGNVDLAEIDGEIAINSGHSAITIRDAAGQVRISTGHADMHLERVTCAPGTCNWIKSGGRPHRHRRGSARRPAIGEP